MNHEELERMAQEERRAYMRAWKRQNKEKVREGNRRYWENRVRRRLEAQDSQGEEATAE